MLPMERTPEPAESAVEEPASQEAMLEAIAQREREMRQSLIEARDALLRRDEEIDRLQSELGARVHGSEASSELTGFEDKRTLDKKVERLASQLEAKDRKLLEQRMRILRMERNLPMRVRARLAALPGGRWISARRQQGFKRAVEAAHERRAHKPAGSRSE